MFNKLILELFSGIYTKEDYQKANATYLAGEFSDEWLLKKFDETSKIFRPKIELEETNKILLSFAEALSKIGNFNTTYGEFTDVIEYSGDLRLFAKDLPLHARIGFRQLIRRNITEEYLLLEDALYYHALAKHSLDEFNSLITTLKKESYGDTKFAELFQTQRMNIITYCRTSINLLFRFLESFVNSVAVNYLKLNELDEDKKKILENTSASMVDRYRDVIEVINPEHNLKEYTDILEAYPKFYNSIYLSLFRYEEEYRQTLLYSDESWMKAMMGIYNLIKGLSIIFWQECFPNSGMPEYLNGLDFDKLENSMGYRMSAVQNKRFAHVKQNFKKDKKKRKKKRV